MSDLTEFLLARIAEDEAVARIAIDHGGTYAPFRSLWNGPGQYPVLSARRLQAECDAKRRIVDDHGWTYLDPYETWKDDTYRKLYGDMRDKRTCNRCGGVASHPNLGVVEHRDAWPCVTLRLLALPYAEHPDFDPAWWV